MSEIKSFTRDQFLLECHAASLLGAWKFWQVMEPNNFSVGTQHFAEEVLVGLMRELMADGWKPRIPQEYEVFSALSKKWPK